MAVQAKTDEVKLIVRVANGEKKFKNLMYARIQRDASNENLFKAGAAIGRMQPKKVDSIYRYDKVQLMGEA